MDFIYNALVFVLKILLKIFFPYEVRGIENFKNFENDSFLICSNHVSNIDAIFIVVSLNKNIYFLAKSELFKNRVMSSILQNLGAIPISRGKHDLEAINKAKDILNSNKILTIFIEGKRSKTGKFLRPRSGATIIANETNSSILPVCITPANGKNVKIFRKTRIQFGPMINRIDLQENSYKEIRNATEMIMDNIKALRYRDQTGKI